MGSSEFESRPVKYLCPFQSEVSRINSIFFLTIFKKVDIIYLSFEKKEETESRDANIILYTHSDLVSGVS